MCSLSDDAMFYNYLPEKDLSTASKTIGKSNDWPLSLFLPFQECANTKLTAGP